jgi:acetoin utilization deacetylase AcuC-like enzyme
VQPNPLEITAVWAEDCLRHEPDAEIWVGLRTPGTEVPECASVIRSARAAAEPPSSRPPVRVPAAIHGRAGLYAYDTMTLIGPGTWAAARAAVDAALTAVDLVRTGVAVAYALCRPPGHHATRGGYGGSCYLNNAAVAAQALIDGGCARVAILDIDAHHGNGTQAIFHDARTAAAARSVEAVVVSLGVDAAVDDPESPLAVTREGYRRSGELIRELGVPVVAVQEGGYHLSTLGALTVATLTGLSSP